MTHPVCDDRFHDARQRDDITNKNRAPCPTCGGTWVDFGMARTADLDDDEIVTCEGCGALVAIDALRPEIDGVPLCIECWGSGTGSRAVTKRESSLERMLRLLDDINARCHFIDTDMRQAEDLQDVDHWRHLVVVSARKSGWGEDAVASSWPLPPVERRFVEHVRVTDGLL